MINGKKIRGSDDGLNLMLINDVFHKVTPGLVSFEMMIVSDFATLYCIGYSEPLQQIFVQFTDCSAKIISGVAVGGWQMRDKFLRLLAYYYSIKDKAGWQNTTENVTPVSNDYVLDAYNKLEYYKTITTGLWATDQPDKVMDPDGVLFQLGE